MLQGSNYQKTKTSHIGKFVARMLLLICIFLNNNHTAHSGVFNSITGGYKNDLNCLKNFVGIGDFSFPPAGETSCTANRATISYIASTGLGLTYVPIYFATLAGVAGVAQNNSSLCTYELHPLPLVDEQIQALLQRQGKKTSIRSLANYYDKVCIEYKGEQFWIGKDECKWQGGILFCTASPEWSDEMLCGFITSTCPCIGTIAGGTISDPEYEKDSDGVIKADKNGNPIIKQEELYKKYFVKHCRMISSSFVMRLMPLEYKGIIDDICNDWKGYSKAAISLISGPVQCLQSTMENIFQQPLDSGVGDINTGQFEIADKLKPKLSALESDADKIKQLIAEAREVIFEARTSRLDTNPKFIDIKQRVDSCIDGSAFSSEYKDDYSYVGIRAITIESSEANDNNLSQLNNAIADLEILSKSIKGRTRLFLESAQSSGKKHQYTMFQNLQSRIKLIAFFVIILYITITGMKIILGGFELTMTNILTQTLKLGFVYYFSMGDAWKEYFYRMIFDASIGVSEILFESVMGASQVNSKCNFTGNHYIESPSKQCNYPNKSMGGSLDPQFLMNDIRTNQPQYACIKGPFIFRPQYERPYKPVKYFEVQASGETVQKIVQTYCTNGNGTTMPAKLIRNDATGEPKLWTCQSPYKLEEGYRLSALREAGIHVDHIDPDLKQNDVLLTAMWELTSELELIDLFPPRTSPVKQIKEKVVRFKTIEAVELERSRVNQKYRRYPDIMKYGVRRNFDYVALFDMIDCKLISYFQYTTTSGFSVLNNFDFFSMVFGGILVLILFILLIWMGIFLAGLVGRLVQSYLVAIIAITILVYFTPLILPLTLFEQTKSIGSDWKDKIIGYAGFPAVLFMSAGVAFAVLDYSMYGSPETFQTKKMFKEDGAIDGKNCWNDDLWSAPAACLIAKLGHRVNTISILGIIFKVGPQGTITLATLFAMLKTSIVILMLTHIVTQFESTMTGLLGIKADISLEGSIFNDPRGLQNLVKKGAGKLKGALKQSVKRNKGAGGKQKPELPDGKDSEEPDTAGAESEDQPQQADNDSTGHSQVTRNRPTARPSRTRNNTAGSGRRNMTGSGRGNTTGSGRGNTAGSDGDYLDREDGDYLDREDTIDLDRGNTASSDGEDTIDLDRGNTASSGRGNTASSGRGNTAGSGRGNTAGSDGGNTAGSDGGGNAN